MKFLQVDGVHPLSYGCEREFVQCHSGNEYRMNCEGETVFNPETLVCDWPDKVKNCQELGSTWEFVRKPVLQDDSIRK